MLLRKMAEKQNMMEKIDLASTEEQGVEDIPYNLPNKQNICMMTQKRLKMFLVLPKPNVFSVSKATTIMHVDSPTKVTRKKTFQTNRK